MIVVDASVLINVLAGAAGDADTARARLHRQALIAPELIDAEVASTFRRQSAAGLLSRERALTALADLTAFPLQRVTHRPLLARCWELRYNLTIYDALYVALAEVLDAVLVTSDGRLSRAPGLRCQVDVLG